MPGTKPGSARRARERQQRGPGAKPHRARPILLASRSVSANSGGCGWLQVVRSVAPSLSLQATSGCKFGAAAGGSLCK
eukprot:scaffold280168_cov26-Tisochrysis_lutea.AAC.1